MLAHLLSFVAAYLFLGFVAPLIVLLVFGPRSAYVRAHAVESLNFNLTWLLYAIVGVALAFLLIGIPILDRPRHRLPGAGHHRLGPGQQRRVLPLPADHPLRPLGHRAGARGGAAAGAVAGVAADRLGQVDPDQVGHAGQPGQGVPELVLQLGRVAAPAAPWRPRRPPRPTTGRSRPPLAAGPGPRTAPRSGSAARPAPRSLLLSVAAGFYARPHGAAQGRAAAAAWPPRPTWPSSSASALAATCRNGTRACAASRPVTGSASAGDAVGPSCRWPPAGSVNVRSFRAGAPKGDRSATA